MKTTYLNLKTGVSSIAIMLLGAGVWGQCPATTPNHGCPTSAITLNSTSMSVAYTTPGTCTFTVPQYVSSITVWVWGAGGGGGGASGRSNTNHDWGSDACAGGGGGGGGGFTQHTISVTAGQVFDITVGAGGTAGQAVALGSTGINTNSGTAGGTGGTSRFFGNGHDLYATGGTGGRSAAARRSGTTDNNQYAQASGGIGGSGFNGTVNYTGGTGSSGLPGGSFDIGGAGGGGAGSTGNGNNFTGTGNNQRIGGAARTCHGGAGANGISPQVNGGPWTGGNGTQIGSGAGGGLVHSSDGTARIANGGVGGNGMIIITFVYPLSVSLSDFSVACNNGRTINWTTESEQNASHFILERSRDGLNWTAIKLVEANGTTNERNTYSVIENELSSVTTYYRLKQIDFNGTIEVHGPISTDCKSSNEMVVYPNPSQNIFAVELNSNSIISGTLIIYDINGKELIRKDVNQIKGMQTLYFDASALTNGTYTVVLEGQKDNEFAPSKLIISK